MAWDHLSPRIAPIPEIPGIPVCAARRPSARGCSPHQRGRPLHSLRCNQDGRPSTSTRTTGPDRAPALQGKSITSTVCAACDRVLVRLEGIAARISIDIAARIDIDTSTSIDIDIDIDDRPRPSARGRNLRGRGWPRAWWPDFLLALTYRLHEAGKKNASPERLA